MSTEKMECLGELASIEARDKNRTELYQDLKAMVRGLHFIPKAMDSNKGS
jgi:hypothetical protein